MMKKIFKNNKIKKFKKRDPWASRNPVLFWKISILVTLVFVFCISAFSYFFYKNVSKNSFSEFSLEQDVFIESINTKKLENVLLKFENRKTIFDETVSVGE